MKIANVIQHKSLYEQDSEVDTRNPVDKFSDTYHLPAITVAGVAALLLLPSTLAITKKVLTRTIPGLGAILQTGFTWDLAAEGKWSDAFLSAGLTALNIGQVFGYAAGGAPGAAATLAEITGQLYLYRIPLIKTYYQEIEGMDVSQVPDEELERAAAELIKQMADKLATDIGNGVLNAVGMGDDQTPPNDITYDAMGNVTGTEPASPADTSSTTTTSKSQSGTVSGGDTRMGPASKGVQQPAIAPKPQPAQTATSKPKTVAAKPVPAVAKAAPAMVPPNYDNLSYRKAFASARALAKKIDPENPGAFRFTWKGKPYQTNIKGERFIPQSAQRQLLVPQQATELAEAGGIGTAVGDFASGALNIWKKIGKIAKGADEAGDAAGAAVKNADELGDVVGANVKALPVEHVIDNVKYTYNPATGKWIDPTKIAVGGRGFSQVPEASMEGRELYRIRSTKIDAAAKAADDAAAAAPKPVEPEAPPAPKSAKPSKPGTVSNIATKATNWIIYGTAFYDAMRDTLAIDLNDPNKLRRLTEIWTKFVAVVGIQKAGLLLGGAAANKMLTLNRLKDKPGFIKGIVSFLSTSAGLLAAQHIATTENFYGVDNIVNWISDNMLGDMDRGPNASQQAGEAELGATPNHSSNSLYDKAYRWAIQAGSNPAAATKYAKMVATEGPNGPIASQLDRHLPNFESVQLAHLYNKLDESTTARNTVSIHRMIKRMLSESNNPDALERTAYVIQMSGLLTEDTNSDNFMANVTAAIAANTKGDKVGAQKALDAAKLNNPATGTDQTNQKKMLDQLAKANPSLAVPNTNPNSTQNQPPNPNATQSEPLTEIGAPPMPGTITHDPGNDLLAAYNEFAAKYPAAKFLLDIVPVTGTATSIVDASQDLYNGKYGQAAIDILGAIPAFKIGKYLSRGLQNVIRTVNKGAKAANVGNATSNLVSNTVGAANAATPQVNAASDVVNESPKMGDHIMLELADGRLIVAPISELRGNSMIVTLDETGHQWLDESPSHDALKIGDGTQSISNTAQFWNGMIDELVHDTPSGWAQLFVDLQHRTGHAARTMPKQWANIWRQQHVALGDELTRGDMLIWINEVENAIDRSELTESSHNPTGGTKLRKMLDSKDAAMLAVWMSSRAGNKGISVAKFAKDKAVQSGLPANHWWGKIKHLVNESADPYSMEKRYYIVRKTSSAAPVDGISGFHRKSEAEKKLATMKNPDKYMVRAIDSTKLPKDEMKESRRGSDINFTPEDIAVIAGLTNLEDAKKHAIRLITRNSRRPMSAEKIKWFTHHINNSKSVRALTKMMYDMLLSGEGLRVLGTVGGMGDNSYRQTFKEEDEDDEDDEEYEEQMYKEQALNCMLDLYDALSSRHVSKILTKLTELGELYQENGVYLPFVEDEAHMSAKRKLRQLSSLLEDNKPAIMSAILHMIKQRGETDSIANLLSVLDHYNIDWPDLEFLDYLIAPSKHDAIRSLLAAYKDGNMDADNVDDIIDMFRQFGHNWPELDIIKQSASGLGDELDEAEYKGKSVPLSKPIRTSPSEGGKFKVYVKDPKTGNIKMVRFGDTTGLSIKRDDPKRRKNYRARHHCDNPGPKTKANYWSCKMWTAKPVGKILKGK